MDTSLAGISVRIGLAFWLALLCNGLAWAEEAGSITHLNGTLSAEHADGSRTLLSIKSIVNSGDVLETAHNTYARIKFLDNSELILRPDTRVKVEQYHFVEQEPAADRSLISLVKGGLRKLSGLIGKRSPPQDKLQTPIAVIGIRGTNYGLLLCQGDCAGIPTLSGVPLNDGLHIDVAGGEITAFNGAGEVTIGTGQFGYVLDYSSPPIIVPMGDGVQVTIPAAIIRNRGNGQTLDDSSCNNQCVVP
jgi:hypothetical protein